MVRETRWCGGICLSQNRMLIGNDSRYKFLLAANKEQKGGAGNLLVECWVVTVFDMVRISSFFWK